MNQSAFVSRACKSVVAAGTTAALVCLLSFANLASGAARIDTRRSKGRITVAARLSPVVGLAAGDRAARMLELKTGGRARITLAISVRGASPLVDPRLGVRIRIDRCRKKWLRKRGAYTCHGRTVAVLADSPAVGRHPLRKLARRQMNHLRLTLTLPQVAPNGLQGQSARLVYKFR